MPPNSKTPSRKRKTPSRKRKTQSRKRKTQSRKPSRTQEDKARAYISGWESADTEAANEELSRVTDALSRVKPEDRQLAKRIANAIYDVLVRTIPTWIARLISLPMAVSMLLIAATMRRSLFSAAVMGQALRSNSWWIPTKFMKMMKKSAEQIKYEPGMKAALEMYMYERGFDNLEGGGDGYIDSWGGYEYGDTYEE